MPFVLMRNKRDWWQGRRTTRLTDWETDESNSDTDRQSTLRVMHSMWSLNSHVFAAFKTEINHRIFHMHFPLLFMVNSIAWHWHNLWYVFSLTHTIVQAVQKKKNSEKTVIDIGQEIRNENKLRHSSFLLFNMRSFSRSSFDLRSCRAALQGNRSGILLPANRLGQKSNSICYYYEYFLRSPLSPLFATFYCSSLSSLRICVTLYWEFLMNWHRNRSFIKIRWVRCQVLEQQGIPFFRGFFPNGFFYCQPDSAMICVYKCILLFFLPYIRQL